MNIVDLDEKLILAYTTIADGNMDERFSDRSVIMVNRRKFLNQFNLHPKLTVEGKQPHSDLILFLDTENTKMWFGINIPGVDGFITKEKEVGILLKLADCIPLILYDPVHQAVGVVHVGWQGAVKNIHLKALEKMTTTFETDPKDVKIWVGPHAHVECYVSDTDPSQLNDPAWQAYLNKREDGWHVDLTGYVADTLNTHGILKKQITIDPRCTVESSEFFSHIRTKKTQEAEGRFLVLAKLR